MSADDTTEAGRRWLEQLARDVRATGKTGLTQFCALGMHHRCADVLNVCSCACHAKKKR